MSEEYEELRFKLPGTDSPGYLKRQMKIRDLLTGPTQPEEMVDFLLDYVQEPKDKEKAKELILDMTSNELYSALLAIKGAKKVISDEKKGKSEEG